MPFIFMLELALSAVIHCLLARLPCTQGRRVSQAFSWSSYVRSFLALLLFSFTSLSSTTIGFFDCVDIGTARVMVSSPAVDCNSAAYDSLFPLMVIILLITLAFPVAIAVFLCLHRAGIRSEKADHVAKWSILFQMYKPQCFFWHCVVLLRRLIYTACTTIHDVRNRGLAFGLVTLVCIGLHHHAEPYKDRVSNRLEISSLLLHGMLAVLLTDLPDPSVADGGSAGVVLLVPVPAAIFLCVVIGVSISQRIELRRRSRASIRDDAP